MATWTKPYLGVEHLETDRYLCTVVKWDDFSEITIYRKPINIATCHEEAMFGNDHLSRAKEYCEKFI
jgi:hypothetical protein